MTRIPFEFLLEELEPPSPWTRPMFGCHAVYVEERIVFILRDKKDPRCDDGVWVATTREHHASLRRELPSLRTVQVLAGINEETVRVWSEGGAVKRALLLDPEADPALKACLEREFSALHEVPGANGVDSLWVIFPASPGSVGH